jgi:hypothetical protein
MLFVGCGGSGLQTLRRLRRELESQLTIAKIPKSEFPGAWQFVAVDVPSKEQLRPSELLEYSHGSYVGLSDIGIGYHGNDGIDDQMRDRHSVRDDFAQWRPDPDLVDVDINIGAGRHRAIGRVVGAYSMNKVLLPSLRAAVDMIAQPASASGLRSIADRLGLPDALSGEIGDPSVVIVSSLGGGAGSGIFIDVADALRLLDSSKAWLDNSIGILYDPSLFSNDKDFYRNGISPNSLAAISELVAGHWNPWQSFPYLPSLSGQGGVKRGPAFPLLFGTGNGSITLGSVESTYNMVASILANLTISPNSHSIFYEWLIGNWGDWSEVSDNAPTIHDVRRTKGRRPLSSFGFSRVSLGRDRLARYSTERMARAIYTGILTRFEDDDDVRAGRKTIDKKVSEVCSRDAHPDLIEQFLNQCGLNEASESNNQVLEALLDAAVVNRCVESMQGFVLEQVSDPKQIIEQVKQAIKDSPDASTRNGRTLLPVVHASIMERVESWIPEIQTRVMDTIVRFVWRYGIRVTIEIVRQATDTELAKAFPAELRSEGTTKLNAGTRLRAAFTEAVAGAAGTLKRGSIPEAIRGKMRTLVDGQVRAVADNEVREIAASLLEDMAANMFSPILRALATAQADMFEDFRGTTFDLLCDEKVPEPLRPAKNELLIDEVDSYPETYTDLMIRSAGSESIALERAFLADMGDKASRQNLNVLPYSLRGNQWMPDLSQFTASTTTPSQMRPSFAFSLDEVKTRCAAWLTSGDVTGDFLSETLRDYLEAGDSAAARKRLGQQFAQLLDRAFVAARPFVELNDRWLTSRFNYESGNCNFAVSSVPIALNEGGDTFRLVDEAMAKHLPDPAARREKYDPNYLGDVEIYAALNPLCPSGIQSLTDPVLSALGTMTTSAAPGKPSSFWSMRRARPLLESIPLPKSSQIALTRGWITARLMGYIKIQTTNKRTECVIDSGSEKATLLSPPLGDPHDAWDWFGMALESALLAEMLASKGDDRAMEALDLLVRLGSASGEDEVRETYEGLNPILLVHPSPPGLVDFGSSTDIEGALEGLIDVCQKLEVPTKPGFHQVPYRTQLAPLIVEAAQQMLTAVKADEPPEHSPFG